MKRIGYFFLLLLSIQVNGQQDVLAIFTDAGSAHPSVKEFNERYLDSLQSAMQGMGVEPQVFNSPMEHPAEVVSLPAIYFIHKGQKHYFKGRYSNIERIQTFVTSQRAFGFGSSNLKKEKVFVWNQQGFDHGIVVKEYAVAGHPEKVKEDDVFNEMLAGLQEGFEHFELKESYEFGDQSKLFYLLMYPYADSKGKYHVSVEILSQHSCKVHVYSNLSEPYSGKKVREVTKEIAIFFEHKHKEELMNDTYFHDGLQVQAPSAPKTWQDLNLNLSAEDKSKDLPSGPLPSGNFSISPSKELIPVSFAFPPPVSQYAGTFPALLGEFSYSNGLLSGTLKVNTASMDMGEPTLNESVLEEQLLFEKWAEISVQFNQEIPGMALNEKNAVDVELSLLGIKKNIVAEVEFRALEQENTFLLMANFELDIRPFPSLEQPDGPAPEKHSIFVRVISPVMLNSK